MNGHSVGTALGVVLGPLFAAGSATRRARVFHPVGVVHAATVHPAIGEGHTVGERLAGGAILRFSGAVWRRERAPDLLGLAVRFRRDRPPSVRADGDDQDLLLATMRSLAVLPCAMLTTDPHDFLGNVYRGVATFVVDGLGRAKLQVRPTSPSPAGDERSERLDRAVRMGTAVLRLEAVTGGRVVELATIRVGPRLVIDEAELNFHPFRHGQGIVPTGFVQELRRAAYLASQAGRRAASES